MKKSLYLLAILLIGCGGGGNKSNSTQPGPSDTNDPLGHLFFAANPLKVEARFLTYAKEAGRLSLIDPGQKQEIWGFEEPGFEFASPFPDLSGAALLSEQQVKIISDDGSDSLLFPLSGDPVRHTGVAADALAYSFSNEAGTSVNVVRFLGSVGNWDTATLNVPWSNTVNSPAAGEPPLLVSSFNDTGALLVVFRPADGQFAVATASSPTEPLSALSTSCPGDGIGTEDNATFIAFAWDYSMGLVYLGDRNGKLYALDPLAACATYDSLPNITLDAEPITHVAVNSTGDIAVSQRNGNIHKLTFNGTNFGADQLISNVCSYPDGTTELSDELLLVTCFIDRTNAENLKRYITYNILTDEAVIITDVTLEQAVNVAIDSNTLKMYRVEDNALGSMVVYDLLTGESEVIKGLFLGGILDLI